MTQEPNIQDLVKLTDFLDTKYRGPFGFRFGWDGLLGLIPGVGDIITGGLSLYIVFRSAQLGCSASVLMRMGLNILFENVMDMIPFVGNVVDFVWKANVKNLELLQAHLQDPHRTRVRSKGLIGLILLTIALMMLGFLVGAIYLLKFLFFDLAA